MSSKPKTRRRAATSSVTGGVWIWLMALGLVAVGIRIYDYRDRLLPGGGPESKPLPLAAAASPRPKAVAAHIPVPATKAVGALASPAVLPLDRPPVEPVSLGAGGLGFAFCGRSGLTNCVADGGTFWMKGVKMRLAGIELPRTDGARCPRERQRGFAAKLRLRDLLNAGGFSVTPAGEAQGQGAELTVLTRAGRSFADELVREGLARRASPENRSWCD